jgi:hypothetical protein
VSALERFEEAVKYESSKNTKFQTIKIVTPTLVTKYKKLEFEKVDAVCAVIPFFCATKP